MRYVEGVDLATRLRVGALEPRQAISFLAQVAGALDAAHAAGLVHRDVKPANLLIASGQGVDRDDHVYLTDFGLTKQRGSQSGLTRGGAFLGTLEYVAPEQIEGRAVDGRADQYALAAVAVECLTGTPPYPRDSDVALINAHLHDAPPSLHERRPALPTGSDVVIARGLAKQPDARYPDCRTLVDALRDALGVTASAPRSRTSASLGGRERRPLVILGAVGGLVVLAILAFGFASRGTSGPVDSATASPASIATDSPEPSPTDEVFPNAAEAATLKALPPDLAKACRRGPEHGLDPDNAEISNFTSRAVGLLCTPANGSGANLVIIRQWEPEARAGDPTGNALSYIAGKQSTPGGDCAISRRANGRWLRAGVDAGGVVCYIDPVTGDAILYWSYRDAAILVKAVDQRGDSAALYDWFKQTAPFIQP